MTISVQRVRRMARKPRIEYPGALYHVIVCGNNRERVFFLQSEKERYLDILEHYQKKYRFKVYAYCVLDNHCHLLIEVSEESLSKIMQGVQQVYTIYYNKKYARVGHVFQQRYKSNLCDKERCLSALIRYIHEAPLRAGLAEGLSYEWSSHRCYLEPEERGLVEAVPALAQFHTELDTAVRLYRQFMEEGLEQRRASEPAAYYLDAPAAREPHERVASAAPCSLARILALVAKENGLSEAVLKSGRRDSAVVKARRQFAYLAFRYSPARQTEIARVLGISNPAVSRILAAFAEQPAEQKAMRDLEKKLKAALKPTG